MLGDLLDGAGVGQAHAPKVPVGLREQASGVGARGGVVLLDPQDGEVGQADGLLVGLAEALVDGQLLVLAQVEGAIDNPSIGGVPFYIRTEGAYRW